jgi:hypothetical protein
MKDKEGRGDTAFARGVSHRQRRGDDTRKHQVLPQVKHLAGEIQLSQNASLNSIVERDAYQRIRYYLRRSESPLRFSSMHIALSSVRLLRIEAERLRITTEDVRRSMRDAVDVEDGSAGV